MATTKEASPVNAQLPETLRREQNSFLRLIDENKDLFDRHSSLTYELRDEDRGWRNSPTIEPLVKMSIEILSILNPNINDVNSKKMRRLTEQVKARIMGLIFGSDDEIDTLTIKGLPNLIFAQSRSTPKSLVLGKAFDEGITDFRTSFREARSPLVSGVQESRAELFKKFEDFLLSNPSNIFAFGDFLSDKKNHGAEIEAIRPFLSSLVDSEQSLARDKKEGTLRRVVKKWTAELNERPTHVIIDELVISIKSPDIREWLEFAAQGEDIASFLKSRPDVSTWPSKLKKELTSFISSKYFNAFSSVERGLDQFKKPLNSKSIPQRFDLKLTAGTEEVTADTGIKKPQENKKGITEITGRQKYPIGTLLREVGKYSIKLLEEDGLKILLQRAASSLDPSDPRMLEDLKKIIMDLRESPYGPGTKKLVDKFVTVEYRSFPIRSINPDRRGLSLDHPESTKTRIVYVIYRNEDGSVIGIEGIYKHDEYDKKFAA